MVQCSRCCQLFLCTSKDNVRRKPCSSPGSILLSIAQRNVTCNLLQVIYLPYCCNLDRLLQMCVIMKENIKGLIDLNGVS